MISNMVKVKNTGQMVLSMKEITSSERKTVLVNSIGPTRVPMLVNSLTIISMETANIDGLIIENMKVTGSLIRCMALVYSHGLTEENTRESTTMIRSKVTVFLPGQMADNMMDIG